MKSKEILITGGAGFIGSHLVKRLVNLGFKVTVTVKYKSVIDCHRLISVWSKINVIEVDLRNLDAILHLKTIKESFDIIIHLAAYNHVGDSFYNISESLMTNLLGTSNLIEFGPKFERFIYTATSEVYGYQQHIPFNENNLPFPLSPYAIGKYGGELYAKLKKYQDNSEILCLRPFNTFGPYQSERAIIPELILKCLKGDKIKTTSGLQTREFNYIDNIIDAFLLSIEVSRVPDSSINIGSGEEISIRDLVKKIHKITNSKSKILIGELNDRPNEIWRMKSDNKKAKELLNWNSKISLDEGLSKTVKWYKNFIKIYFKDGGLVQL